MIYKKMSNFRVYDINEITEIIVNGCKGYYINCELEEKIKNKFGGEAFSLNIIEDPNITDDFEIKRGVFKVKKYQKEHVIAQLSKYIDSLEAEDWIDLEMKVSKYFDWI